MGRYALAGATVVFAAVSGAALALLLPRVAPPTRGVDTSREGDSDDPPAPGPASSAPPGLAARLAGGEAAPTTAPAESEPKTIHGVLVDADGEPVRDAMVVLYRERPAWDGLVRLNDEARKRTGGDGRFRFAGLGPGDGWVKAYGPSRVPTVAARATVGGPSVRIVLPVPRTVTVRVLGPDGRPVWRVPVAVRSQGRESDLPPPEQKPGSDWTRYLTWWEEGPIQREDTDRAGEARVRVGEGPFVVTVAPPIEMDLLAPAPIPVEGDTLTVRLEAGLAVSGVLVDREGQPVSGAFVWWRKPGGTWTSKRVGSGGSYSIGALPEGTVELWADMFGREPPPGGKPFVTTAGRADVDVVVDLGGELRVRIENWRAGVGGDAVLRDRTESFGRMSVLPARVSASGEAMFRRLVADHTYSLHVATDDGKLAAVRDDAAGDGDSIRVKLTPVAPLRVTIESDVPFSVANVTVADFVVPWSPVGEEGSKEIRVDDLPTGRLTVEVAGRTAKGALLSGAAESDVPGHARVRLVEVREAGR